MFTSSFRLHSIHRPAGDATLHPQSTIKSRQVSKSPSAPRGAQRQDWTNPAFDRLVEKVLGELDPARRLQLYQQAEEVLTTDYGGVFVFHQIGLALRKPWIKGYLRNPDGTVGLQLDFTKLYISRK